MIAVDAGPLVALFNRRDNHHLKALEFFRCADATFVTNIALLTELAHLLSSAGSVRVEALNWIAETFIIDLGTASDLRRIIEIMTKYGDLPADFADASLIAMCERLNIGQIATFDKDFDVYQLASGTRLQNMLQIGA